MELARKRIEGISELKNVYYIYGDEELLVEEALKRLKKLLSAEVDADFNMEVLSATDAGAERIVDSAETIPLLSDRRLVIARDASALSRKEQETLCAYLDRPNPATTLVLVARVPGAGEPHDANVIKRVESSPLFKKAASVGETLKFTMGRGRRQKLEEWVAEQFKKRGKRIETPAREVLVEKVGRELRDLEDAIERVCLFAADSELIGTAEVKQVVAPAAEQGVFELVDSVADRRRDVSLYLVNRLLRQGESPQRLFGLLLRQFRLIARCKSLSLDHDHSTIASELQIPPFLVSKCLAQARRFSPERLRSAFSEFKRAQEEMYSSKYLPESDYQGHVLETLIVKIVG
jgi:DNA polymerase III subunit delta